MNLGGRVQDIMALFLAAPTLGDLVKLYRNSLCSLLCFKENTALTCKICLYCPCSFRCVFNLDTKHNMKFK